MDFVNLGYVKKTSDYLAACDIVILPIRDQTLGLHSRIVEAMMAGKPIIATREACCGFMGYIQESGILICRSLEEMAATVCRLSKDPSKLRALGKRNRGLASRIFSVNRVGKALENAYLSIIRV